MDTRTELEATVAILSYDLLTLSEQDYPLLAAIWDNDEDACYDEIGDD